MKKSDLNPIYAVINQALSSCFTFGILIIASRVLPESHFGVYSLLVVVLALFALAPQAFVFMPMMSMSRDINSLGSIIYTHFSILCFLIFISLGLSTTLYFFNKESVIGYVNLIPILFWVVSFLLHEFLKRILYIGDKHKDLVFYEIIKAFSAIIALSLIYLWIGKLDIDAILIGLSFGYLCFSLAVIAKINILNNPSQSSKASYLENFDFGKWIFLGNGISYIQNNFFVYVTALLLPLETIAGLNAVRSLIGFSTVIFLAIDNYLAPKLIAIYQEQGFTQLCDKVKSFYLKIGWFIAFIYLIIGIFSESIIIIIFGERYADSSHYLQYFLIASFFGFMARPLLILSRTIHVTNIIFRGSIIPAIFALFCSYPVILIFQDMGAVSMSLLGSLLFLVSLSFFFFKYRTQSRNSNNF